MRRRVHGVAPGPKNGTSRQPMNAACTARSASSPLARSMTTEILISLVEIIPMLMLAAAKGTTISIETNGEDEAEAMQALKNLINDYFGEGK